jgi:DNA-binding MarR family transcriptional regulator
MTDIKKTSPLSSPNQAPVTINDDALIKSMELIYFGYRDFIAWPDEVLQQYGLGRAHHRVLHFVGRSPGMTVAALLALLKITKQSLSRVLNGLLEKDYIKQEIGHQDKRQRLLYLTAKGVKLVAHITDHQKTYMKKACLEAGATSMEGFWHMLTALLSDENKKDVTYHVNKIHKE